MSMASVFVVSFDFHGWVRDLTRDSEVARSQGGRTVIEQRNDMLA